jgi:hypothetical protein
MPREKIDIALEAAKAAGMFFSDLSEWYDVKLIIVLNS